MSCLSGLLDKKGQEIRARLLCYMPKEIVCLFVCLTEGSWRQSYYVDVLQNHLTCTWSCGPFGIVSMRRHTLGGVGRNVWNVAAPFHHLQDEANTRKAFGNSNIVSGGGSVTDKQIAALSLENSCVQQMPSVFHEGLRSLLKNAGDDMKQSAC